MFGLLKSISLKGGIEKKIGIPMKIILSLKTKNLGLSHHPVVFHTLFSM